MPTQPLLPDQLSNMDAWWRAANYLSVGQIYLYDNPLLTEPLKREHIKPRLLGHWGTTPGLNFLYVHLNRLIRERDLNMIYVCGPGHGGPGMVANAYLEGTYTEVYQNITQDTPGIRKLFKQFSFPGGIPSHVAPETPGSIHEGGELGYALSHAFGAAFDNPDLIVACVIGDGEAETGALATGWHGNKFLNPTHDGIVLPILHLNGYKIAGPTVLARIPRVELETLIRGLGYKPYWVEGGDDHTAMHQEMAATLDAIADDIKTIQDDARVRDSTARPAFPMIVLKTPKGWTGPKTVDGQTVEGTWRAHQVPMSDMNKPDHIRVLQTWMHSYKPEELFDAQGTLRAEIASLAPRGNRRMSANPHANGGILMRELEMPDFRSYAVKVPKPGAVEGESTRELGKFLRDIMTLNMDTKNFRVFGPDETSSNRLNALWEVTDRTSTAEVIAGDDHVSPNGRVMEVLSEHQCEGWLEGYLLTGRHGFFSCYEAFIHIIDSMFNQHAKWLDTTRTIPWRRPISSVNLLLTSHVWRQDHNGFSHQDPGFLDLVANKKADVTRIYLPPDANTLLSVADHCLRSKQYVNVIVAGKQPEPQWLDMDTAIKHCTAGIGIWEWASNDREGEPDVVMASAGDVPTLETLAAVELLWHYFPELKVRMVNVVDLFRLQSHGEHPHGMTDQNFDSIFTADKAVVFAFHGYPGLIHKFTYKRTNHENFHVHGFSEEGSTTTPFDMVTLNGLDRFHLVNQVIDRVPKLAARGAHVKQELLYKLIEHRNYVNEHGEDMPEILNWKWKGKPMNDAMDRALGMISDRQQAEEQFRVRGGFIIAGLAVVLAIATLLGNNVQQDVLRYSIETADAYAFYQAKNIRQTDLELALDQLKVSQANPANPLSAEQQVMVAALMDDYAGTITRYDSEPDPTDPTNPLKGEGKKELLARARYLESERNMSAERDNNYDYASVLLQISIVVMGAAIIVVSRPLLILSLLLAGIGVLFILNGLLLLIIPLPF